MNVQESRISIKAVTLYVRTPYGVHADIENRRGFSRSLQCSRDYWSVISSQEQGSVSRLCHVYAREFALGEHDSRTGLRGGKLPSRILRIAGKFPRADVESDVYFAKGKYTGS